MDENRLLRFDRPHSWRLVPLLLVSVVAPSVQAQDPLQAANREFAERHRPWIENYCGKCHFGSAVQAGVNLELDRNVEALLLNPEKWELVRDALLDEAMPPEDEPQPTPDEREALTQWLDHVLETLRCSTPINAGQVTLRRLNRTEYRNTVRDWLNVDYTPAEQFPGDDSGYGFDNIGDVLTLPPILLEKYLAAAEQIAGEAIVDVESLKTDRQFAGADFDPCDGAYAGADMMVVSSNGTIQTRTAVSVPGTYRITLSATGHQAGDDPVRMRLLINDRAVSDFEVKAPFPEVESFSVDVDLPKDEFKLGVSFLNDFYDPNDTRAVGNDRNLVLASTRITGPTTLAPETFPESHRRLMTVSPDDQTTAVEAARQLIPTWIRSAFRRPAAPEEIDRLVALFNTANDAGLNFDLSMRVVLQSLLASPHFLYKVEAPAPADGSPRSLSDHELASALSYFLWSTMPDEELSRLADQQNLSDPLTYRQQIDRMLRDPKASNLVENFAVQWLQLRQLDLANPNPDLFAEFNTDLRADMQRETRMFVEHIFRENESIARLLDNQYSFVNQRLASWYGIDGVEGDEFRRVDVSGQHRGGLLTHGSILTLTSFPARTSPVKRGKWIMENLLGQIPPPPDPDAMPLDEQRELVGTLRQRMEQHRTNPTCASCHARMDPLGFALEHFDAVGRHRMEDAGEPIDASAEFPDGLVLYGSEGLQQMLSGEEFDAFLRCFVQKLMIFGLGRGLEYQDECAVDAIIEAAAQDDYRFHSIVQAIAHSEPFRKRQLRGGK